MSQIGIFPKTNKIKTSVLNFPSDGLHWTGLQLLTHQLQKSGFYKQTKPLSEKSLTGQQFQRQYKHANKWRPAHMVLKINYVANLELKSTV